MDLNTLSNVLLHTYSADETSRHQAEVTLANLPSISGSISLLVQLTNGENTPREISQAAAIALKNLISKNWSNTMEELTANPNEALFVLADDEKLNYRKHILQALFHSQDNSIRGLLAECMANIAKRDFPEKWPDLVNEICLTIQSGNPNSIHNALLALQKLIKVYEYANDTKREPLNAVVAATFPLLRTMLEQLISNESVEADRCVHLACKVFWTSFHFHIPSFLLNLTELGAWMQIFNSVLARGSTAATEGMSEDDLSALPIWKAKKWVGQIFCCFYTRYGNSNHIDDSLKEVCEFFRTQVAPTVLGTVLQTLSLRKNGQFCSDRVVQLCLVYLQNAIEPSITYKLLKPHLHFILFEVIHPILCLSPSDLQLWSEDPHEFVRKTHDVFEDFCDPVVAASSLLSDLAKKRGKDCLSDILVFYTNVLNTYESQAAENKDHIQKEAALHALCSLDSILTTSKVHRESIEPLIIQHVLPEFKNPNGFMRLRVCKILADDFTKNIEFKNQDTLIQSVHGVLQCMQDKELPVQIEGAKTLRSLVVYKYSSTVLDVIRPLLPQVLDQYFKLMDEIGNDEVVIALETIIDQYGDEIGPFSVQLIEKLMDCFRQFAGAGEEDDEAAMAAMQCLDAVNTILLSIHNHPELYPIVEPHLVPTILNLMKSDDGIEYLDCVIDILGSLTYYSKGISANLWNVFPMIFVSFNTWANDYAVHYIPVIDNFIGRDIDGFLAGNVNGVSFLEMTLNMAKTIFENTGADETEIFSACRLFYSILHNCFNRVDDYVEGIMKLVCEKIAAGQNDKINTSLLGVVGSSFFYNPHRTLAALDKLGAVQHVFTLWLASPDRFESFLDKKLFCLGLTSILKLPFNNLPVVLQGNMNNIVLKISEMLTLIVQKQDLTVTEENPADENDFDHFESIIEKGGYDSNEDVEDYEDEDIALALKEFRDDANLNSNFLYDLDGDDDDYSSALDNVEEMSFFLESLQAAVKQQQYAGLQNLPELQQSCQILSSEAQRRAEKAAEETA